MLVTFKDRLEKGWVLLDNNKGGNDKTPIFILNSMRKLKYFWTFSAFPVCPKQYSLVSRHKRNIRNIQKIKGEFISKLIFPFFSLEKNPFSIKKAVLFSKLAPFLFMFWSLLTSSIFWYLQEITVIRIYSCTLGGYILKL